MKLNEATASYFITETYNSDPSAYQNLGSTYGTIYHSNIMRNCRFYLGYHKGKGRKNESNALQNLGLRNETTRQDGPFTIPAERIIRNEMQLQDPHNIESSAIIDRKFLKNDPHVLLQEYIDKAQSCSSKEELVQLDDETHNLIRDAAKAYLAQTSVDPIRLLQQLEASQAKADDAQKRSVDVADAARTDMLTVVDKSFASVDKAVDKAFGTVDKAGQREHERFMTTPPVRRLQYTEVNSHSPREEKLRWNSDLNKMNTRLQQELAETQERLGEAHVLLWDEDMRGQVMEEKLGSAQKDIARLAGYCERLKVEASTMASEHAAKCEQNAATVARFKTEAEALDNQKAAAMAARVAQLEAELAAAAANHQAWVDSVGQDSDLWQNQKKEEMAQLQAESAATNLQHAATVAQVQAESAARDVQHAATVARLEAEAAASAAQHTATVERLEAEAAAAAANFQDWQDAVGQDSDLWQTQKKEQIEGLERMIAAASGHAQSLMAELQAAFEMMNAIRTSDSM